MDDDDEDDDRDGEDDVELLLELRDGEDDRTDEPDDFEDDERLGAGAEYAGCERVTGTRTEPDDEDERFEPA